MGWYYYIFGLFFFPKYVARKDRGFDSRRNRIIDVDEYEEAYKDHKDDKDKFEENKEK